MPLLADFHAELIDDRIVVPEDALARIRRAGGARLRVTVELAAGGADELALRGIDAATVDAVAAAQKIEPDLAALVLSGEGIAHATPLGGRLGTLTGPVT